MARKLFGTDGVRGVAIQHGIAAPREQVERRKKRMGQRVEIFITDGGKIDEIDAAIGRLGMTLAAIDRDAMAALTKITAETESQRRKPSFMNGRSGSNSIYQACSS